MDEFDFLLRDLTIVDGSLRPPYSGSIGVQGDKIVQLGRVTGDAKEVVDGSGLVAMPGFIDAHSHADRSILWFPKCENYVLQGVATFVGGQCGNTLAPIRDAIPVRGTLITEHLHELYPYKYYIPDRSPIPLDQVNVLMKKHFGWRIEWHTMAEYLKKVESVGISTNFAPLVGHGTCRSVVMGEDFKRPCKPAEVAEIKELIRSGMDDGCIGMSVGLDYDPGVFSDRKELIECISVLRDYNGVFCPHSRRTGRRRDMAAGHRMPDKVDAINEVLDLCRETGLRTNIAHLFTGWYVTPQNAPDVLEEANRRATLMVIDKALKEGLDVSFDVIPSALRTKFGGSSYLCALFEPWLRECGSREEFAKWLKVRDYRDEIKDAIARGKWYIREGTNPNVNPRWAENITILQHRNRNHVDKTLARIAEERRKDPFETWFDLIVEDPDARSGTGSGENQDAPYHAIFYQHPVASVGLDISVTDYEHEEKIPPWSTPGISTFSAYIGFFDKFVKRQKALTLEQAVYKTSAYIAQRHNLKNRGQIKEGYYADILIMDYENLEVTGTPLQPKLPPRGVRHLFVNGVQVVKDSRHTGVTPGRILRREARF